MKSFVPRGTCRLQVHCLLAVTVQIIITADWQKLKKQQHSHKRSFLIRISLWVYVYVRRGSPPSAIFANLSNIMKSCVKLVFHMGIRSAGTYQACRFNIIIMQVELSYYTASYLFRFRKLYIHTQGNYPCQVYFGYSSCVCTNCWTEAPDGVRGFKYILRNLNDKLRLFVEGI